MCFGLYQRGALVSLLAVTLLCLNCRLSAADAVKAELGRSECWVGEGIPLIVTLYSPGPFSGTAGFELPEIPVTAIVPTGRPTVGSETVDAESMLTQRHEFRIFSQQSGTVTIPPIAIRFHAQQSFTAKPELVQASTPELQFTSRRPPGTDNMALVVAANNLSVQQSWQPSETQQLVAGDVIVRRITRTADDTTAMMLRDLDTTADRGIQVHTTAPQLQDKTERGQFSAERVDIIKYQIQQPGTCTLPDLQITWWDLKSEKIRTETLDGVTLTVASAETARASQPAPLDRRYTWLLASLVFVAAVVAIRPASHWIIAARERSRTPAMRAAERLLNACDRNDAAAAYSAVLDWKRAAVSPEVGSTNTAPQWQQFEDACAELASRLFGADGVSSAWHGGRLRQTFLDARQTLRESQPHAAANRIPALNP